MLETTAATAGGRTMLLLDTGVGYAPKITAAKADRGALCVQNGVSVFRQPE